MKSTSYFRVAFATTFNIILNALMLGHYVWLEGRVRNGIFMNWARRFHYKPKNRDLPLPLNPPTMRRALPGYCQQKYMVPDAIGAL